MANTARLGMMITALQNTTGTAVGRPTEERAKRELAKVGAEETLRSSKAMPAGQTMAKMGRRRAARNGAKEIITRLQGCPSTSARIIAMMRLIA